jgi:hypothetical protein
LSRAALTGLAGGYVRSEITAGKIPAQCMLIQQHGRLVDLECFGRAGPGGPVAPMTPDTIFQIYSMVESCDLGRRR